MVRRKSRKQIILSARQNWLERVQEAGLEALFDLQVAWSGKTIALDKKLIMPLLINALQNGLIDPFQAVTILSANVIQHNDSKLNEREYVKRLVLLYTAENFDEICEAENLSPKKRLHKAIQAVFNSASRSETEKLQQAKLMCFIQDVLDGSRNKFWARTGITEFFRSVANDNEFSRSDIALIMHSYNHKAFMDHAQNKIDKGQRKEEEISTSPVDLNELIANLKSLKKQGRVTVTQSAVLIHYFAHAMDRRKGGGEYYTDHTMSVAGLVQAHGPDYFSGTAAEIEEKVWKATLVALLHDIGEKNQALILESLRGLLPDDVVDAVILMHKPDNQDYFPYTQNIGAHELTRFVKLCDLVHNSSDWREIQMQLASEPTEKCRSVSNKQTHIYPVVANYFVFTENPKNASVSLMDFLGEQAGYTQEQIDHLVRLTKKDGGSDTTKLPSPAFSPVTEDIFDRISIARKGYDTEYANARGKENTPLYPGTNVRLGS